MMPGEQKTRKDDMNEVAVSSLCRSKSIQNLEHMEQKKLVVYALWLPFQHKNIGNLDRYHSLYLRY